MLFNRTMLRPSDAHSMPVFSEIRSGRIFSEACCSHLGKAFRRLQDCCWKLEHLRITHVPP